MSNQPETPAEQASCGGCLNFDRITAGKVLTNHGWCAPLSIYPHTEQEGQVFPPGVKRAKRGELSKPAIRRLEQIVEACPHRRSR